MSRRPFPLFAAAYVAKLWRRSLPARFGVISTVALVILGVVLNALITADVRDRAREAAGERAEAIATAGLEPHLSPRHLDGMTDAELDRIDRLVKTQRLRATGLRRVKIFNAEPRVVYSDDRRQVGRSAADSDPVQAALSGRVVSELATGVNHDGAGERMLEVFVPLVQQRAGHSAGVLEVYLPYAPVAAKIAESRRRLQLALALGLVLLWAALLHLVVQASRRLREQSDENVRIAFHDALTELPNRRLLYARIEKEYARLRGDDDHFALLLLDLDGFKEVNDSLGHHAGDELLREVAERLRAALPAGDMVARLGGDEFAVVVGGTGASVAPSLAGELQLALAKPFRISGADVRVRASIGIAASSSAESADVLLRNADLSMYRAKATGEDAMVFAPEMHDALVERLTLQNELRIALETSGLALHYQPIVSAEEGRVEALEALVRWPHAERGMIPPSEFVPLAEQAGLIGALGGWVLDEACRQLRAWRDEGAVGADVAVSVNVSAMQLADFGFVRRVGQALEQAGLDPSCLILEVTETVLMEEHRLAEQQLRALQALGVVVALDDFGTGYSSLSRLSTLPVDYLKIDRSFVSKMGGLAPGSLVTATIVAMGRDLGLKVVAEGVETEEQMRILRRLGCDMLQGFLLARPVPANAIPSAQERINDARDTAELGLPAPAETTGDILRSVAAAAANGRPPAA